MIHPCRRARLTPEPFSRDRVGYIRANRLQRDRAVEPIVPGGIDDAHPAFAERAGDLVVTD
jgi:hypothetical protein